MKPQNIILWQSRKVKFRAYHYTGTIYGYNNNTFITIHVMINQASSQGTHTHTEVTILYTSIIVVLVIHCMCSVLAPLAIWNNFHKQLLRQT